MYNINTINIINIFQETREHNLLAKLEEVKVAAATAALIKMSKVIWANYCMPIIGSLKERITSSKTTSAI